MGDCYLWLQPVLASVKLSLLKIEFNGSKSVFEIVCGAEFWFRTGWSALFLVAVCLIVSLNLFEFYDFG